MSNAYVTVCLPPTQPGNVYDAIKTAMAPYDFNSAANDWGGGEWDHWHIDAGDTRRYPVKPEYDGDPRLIYADQWEPTPNRQRLPLQCDGGPVGLLDLDRLQTDAVSDAPAERQWAIATFALLPLDRLWIDPDTPGPFLDVLPDATTTEAYEHQCVVYAREATRYIESLADDRIIVQLRYHC